MRDRSATTSSAKRNVRAIATALLIGLLSGCSGIKPYPNELEKNLHMRTSTDSGSIFSRVRASLSILRVDAQCRTEYEGTVDLRNGAADVGVPVDRWSYLIFDFSSSGLFSGNSTIKQATLLKPRTGYRYDVEVIYRDEMYNIAIHEVRAGSTGDREITLRGLDACTQG